MFREISLLDECVDRILSINKTNIEIQKGNFTSWWQKKSDIEFYIFLNDGISSNFDSSERV